MKEYILGKFTTPLLQFIHVILLLQVDLSYQGSAGQAISLISDAMIPLTASYTDGREKTRK